VQTPPNNGGFMVAAYVAAAVIYLAYAAYLYWKSRGR
jgi:hypothetical protein